MANDDPPAQGATRRSHSVPGRPRHWVLGATALACVLVGAAIGAVIASAGQAAPGPAVTAVRHLVVGSATAASEQTADGSQLDAFNRPDDPVRLGATPGGAPWRAVTGTWGVLDEAAYVSAPTGGTSLAVLEPGRPPAAAQVRAAAVTSQAGLVFRYQDRANYWALVALPHYGTWAVLRVVGGKQDVVANTGVVPTSAGTLVGVVLHGPVVDVAINGRVVRTLADPALVGATGVGLATGGTSAGQARFTDFRVTPVGG